MSGPAPFRRREESPLSRAIAERSERRRVKAARYLVVRASDGAVLSMTDDLQAAEKRAAAIGGRVVAQEQAAVQRAERRAARVGRGLR